MTSVPKPLKFLRPHYPKMIEIYESWPASDVKRFLADILSVLGMTYSDDGRRDTLKYRLAGASVELGSWGHEYVRHLSGEIINEHNARLEKEESIDELFKLALEIVPFFMTHNAEADACDLLIEMEALDHLIEFVDKNTYERVCLYILA